MKSKLGMLLVLCTMVSAIIIGLGVVFLIVRHNEPAPIEDSDLIPSVSDSSAMVGTYRDGYPRLIGIVPKARRTEVEALFNNYMWTKADIERARNVVDLEADNVLSFREAARSDVVKCPRRNDVTDTL